MFSVGKLKHSTRNGKIVKTLDTDLKKNRDAVDIAHWDAIDISHCIPQGIITYWFDNLYGKDIFK